MQDFIAWTVTLATPLFVLGCIIWDEWSRYRKDRAEQSPPVTQDDFSVRILPHRERDKRAVARTRYTHAANYLPPGVLSEERKESS